MTYAQKLRDPRWQKRRLEVLQKAEFRCESCGTGTMELHVHRPVYRKGFEPWDYKFLVCLCSDCHEKAEFAREEACCAIGRMQASEAVKLFHAINEAVDGVEDSPASKVLSMARRRICHHESTLR